MVYKARLLLSGRQKIAVVLLVLLCIAFLTNYPRVTEAILAFLLGGVVPGTDIIVSPDVVLMLVIGVFIFGIVGSIVRMYFKAARGKRNFRIAVQSIESVAVLPVARDMVIGAEPSVGIKVGSAVRKRHAFRMFMTTSFRKLGQALQIFSETIGGVLLSVGGAIKSGVAATASAIWKAVRILIEAIFTILVLLWFAITDSVKFIARMTVKVSKLIANVMMRIALSITQATRVSWRFALPRLKKIDAQLEMQFRKFETRASNQIRRPEAVQTVALMGREYRKSLAGLRPTIALRSARQKAVTIKPKALVMPRGSRVKG